MAALWKYNVTVQLGTTHEEFTAAPIYHSRQNNVCAYMHNVCISKTENGINVKTSEIIDCPHATMMKTIKWAVSCCVVNLRVMKKNQSHLLCSFLGQKKKNLIKIPIRTEEINGMKIHCKLTAYLGAIIMQRGFKNPFFHFTAFS